jgi:glycolate oxidase iron-sulfur subunit
MGHGIELISSPEYKQKLDQCIHVGMCLEACPTYAVFGWEMDGPRGRINLMRAAAEDRLTPEEWETAFAPHIDLCLACRACETACPSGVQYGLLFEGARTAIEERRKVGAVERVVRWLGLRQMLPHLTRLKLLARLLWLYQVVGLHRLMRSIPILPKPLQVMNAILPPIVPRYTDYRMPAPAIGPNRGRVAFFTGCVQEAFLSPVNAATVRVLQRNGYEVYAPPMQTCCGAPHLHAGLEEWALELARRNVDALLEQDVVAVISNAGGCGLVLKEYAHLLRDDPIYAERAKQLVSKVQDINEFLADHLHLPPQGVVRARATYADSCHLRHGQHIAKQPRELLKRVPGLEVVELARPDRCCGSAGIYNIGHPDTANEILEMKMADIAGTGANVIVTSNTGCYMQYVAGVRGTGLPTKVMHVVEVLDLSYQTDGERVPVA